MTILNPRRRSGLTDGMLVELTIDQNGAVSEYSVPGGKLSKDEMRAVGNFLLFTSFKAAVAFSGQPVPARQDAAEYRAVGPGLAPRNDVGS